MSKKPLRGVNLGGWLLIEKWMTPSIFNGTNAVDEHSLSLTKKGREIIEQHRKSFIKESDFKWLSKNKIDIVRIPIGYWIFDGDDGLLANIKYLDWAMEMARKYDIEVLIDLHGHKGSQNGHDHSGKSGRKDWFKNKENRLHSIQILERIAKRYTKHPKFWGLQLINEPPIRLFHLKLRSFYKESYKRLQKIVGPQTRIIFSDSFTPRLMSGALPRSNKAVMDIHIYQPHRFWTKYVPLGTFLWWLKKQKDLIKRLSKTQPIIIGEWSGVIRYEDLRRIPESKQGIFTKKYIQNQVSTFQHAQAWFYWSYKTEGKDAWNYRHLVESGII